MVAITNEILFDTMNYQTYATDKRSTQVVLCSYRSGHKPDCLGRILCPCCSKEKCNAQCYSNERHVRCIMAVLFAVEILHLGGHSDTNEILDEDKAS